MRESITTLHSFEIERLPLENGIILQNVIISYRTLGKLSAACDNVVLVTHGNTSGPQMLDPNSNSGEGLWSDIVGPGKAIDTDRFYVICPNMLGSSYGSTNASSINPSTNKPYGSDFPRITVTDIVKTQKLLIDSLGIKRLVAVAGPSYGGFQAFQWAIDYPEFMYGIIAAVSSPVVPTVTAQNNLKKILSSLSHNPSWRNGNYYETVRDMVSTMTTLRIETLKDYGYEQQLADTISNKRNIDRMVEDEAAQWAKEFDANSLVILARALLDYDVLSNASRIKAKVLYALSSTDKLFPAQLADLVMPALKSAGVNAEYFLIESKRGHMASGDKNAKEWNSTLHNFIEGLA